MWKLKKRLKIEERFDQVYVYDLSKPDPDIDQYLIGNNHGHANGWIPRTQVFGKVVEIL